MKKPEKIKINGKAYKVRYEPIDGFEGLVFYGDDLITIESEMPLERIKTALGHEIAHAIMYEYDFVGVELSEELICGTFWHLLRDVYVNNPEVARFVFARS